MVDIGRNAISRQTAQELLDPILPGRSAHYSQSLLRKLIGEGILADDLIPLEDGGRAVPAIRFGYERMADYNLARRLLDRHVPDSSPADAFAEGGYFRRVFSADRVYDFRGLLSALVVLVPERLGQELSQLIPSLEHTPGFADAFIEALPWREGSHITPHAIEYVEGLLANAESGAATYSAGDSAMNNILLISGQPGHPLNARWLHTRLLSLSMPDRDRSWSTFLHRSRHTQSWKTREVIERLLDWAWPENADDTDPCEGFDDEVAELAAITLTWCLTTSNRFIRDRATKGLVCVLRHRLGLCKTLLQMFGSIDDPYVTERLLCGIYGAVMRSDVQDDVALVANAVYEHVFATRSPPAHVLIRDYARGIVEYAVSLGCVMTVDLAHVRPPYQSDPLPQDIPSWSALKALYSSNGYYPLVESLSPNWGDFSRYVLESRAVHAWTDQDDPFTEYRRLDEERASISESLAVRWHDARFKGVFPSFQEALVAYEGQEGSSAASGTAELLEQAIREDADVARIAEQWSEQVERFRASLSPDERAQLERFEAANRRHGEAHEAAQSRHRAQCLESDLASRWILARVIELGWTPERFAEFDRGVNTGTRDAQKPERIGKKYQWMALHEFAARVVDHRPLHHDWDGSQHYEGPWQLGMRDIDPSLLQRAAPADRSENRCWWVPLDDPLQGATRLDDLAWLSDAASVPDLLPLLSLRRPSDGSLWYPLELSSEWNEPDNVREHRGSEDRRRITFSLGARLVPAATANEFLEVAKRGEWTGTDVVARDYYSPFVGEFAWAPSFADYVTDARKHFGDELGGNGQIAPFDRTDEVVAQTVMRYSHEGKGLDCSLIDSITGCVPSIWLAQRMGLRWNLRNFEFVDESGSIVAYDPAFEHHGPSGFLVEQNAWSHFLRAFDLCVVWLLIGEKMRISERFDRDDQPRITVFRHVYALSNNAPSRASRTFCNLGQTPHPY